MDLKNYDRLDYLFKLFVVIALGITALVLADDILVPMAFAAILAVAMHPLVARLRKWKFPAVLAISVVLLVTVIILFLLGWLVMNQLVSLSNDLPDLQFQFEEFAAKTSEFLSEKLGISTTDQNQMITEFMKNISGYAGEFLVSTSNVVTTFIQIPVYIFLFLIYRKKFKAFFKSLTSSSSKISWDKDIESIIQGYISGLTLVTIIVTLLNTIGLLIIGIDHAIFFGILSGVLTIIPYVGIVIGALFPITMALITKDSIWYAVGVIAVFSVVQFLEGNFISPKITGSKVKINVFAAIVALLFGGKILGIAGMILAIPTIGIIKVLLPHSRLKLLTVLIDDSDDLPSSKSNESNQSNSSKSQ